MSSAVVKTVVTGAPKYTEEVHDTMVEQAAKGATNRILAQANGIHPDTLQSWFKKGREKPDDFPDYARLVEEIEKARAELAVEMSSRVIEAANSGLPNTWQAAATYLERRYPDEWGRHEKRTIEGGDDRPQVNVLVLNDPNAREAHQVLLGRIAGSVGGPVSTGEPIGSGVRGELEAGPEG